MSDAIANSRLIACDDTCVTFKWKDYRAEGAERFKITTLATDEFIRRFLIHVLPEGFHRIRHYGLFDSGARALRLTTQRKRRLVQLLHAFDIHEEGGGPRDIAEQILRSGQAQIPSVEWKDSHTRRAANRLIHDSIALVERDYLKLLRCG